MSNKDKTTWYASMPDMANSNAKDLAEILANIVTDMDEDPAEAISELFDGNSP